MKVITIGSATQDIFIQYEQQKTVRLPDEHGQLQSMLVVPEGRKIDVDLLIYTTGGGATNTAVSFSRLGFSVAAFFKIGTDPQGDFICNELSAQQIDIHMAQRTNESMTSVSFIIPSPSADRTVFVYRGAGTTIDTKDIDYNALRNYETVYISSLGGQSESLLPTIVQHAKKYNAFVAINPGSSQLKNGAHDVRKALSSTDVLIVNEYEAQLLMDTYEQTPTSSSVKKTHNNNEAELLASDNEHSFNVRTFFRAILKQGPSIVIVTNGAEGVYVAHGDTIFFHPSVTVPVVSTVGAGDAFASCFVACIRHGQAIEYAIRAGVLNSASVISYLDAKTGLLTLEEIQEKIAALSPELLKKYHL